MDLYGFSLKAILAFVRLKRILEVVSYVIAIAAGIGWFVSSIFARDHRLKKWLKWLFGGTCVVAIIAALLCSSEQTTPATSATAVSSTGPNSPAANISNVGSGATVAVTQVSGNQTVNNGISETTMRELLRDKCIAANVELMVKYPKGYVLLGIAAGKIAYEPCGPGVSFKANPDDIRLSIDMNRHTAMLQFRKLEMDYPDGGPSFFYDCAFEFPHLENQPSRAFTVPMRPGFVPYCEVLDMERGIFVIGFK